MPINVPQYGGQQVGVAPAPGVQVPVGSGGQDALGSVAGLVNTLGRRAAEKAAEQDRAALIRDKAAVSDAVALVNGRYIKDVGELKRADGAYLVGIYGDKVKDFGSFVDETANSLLNARQRQLFHDERNRTLSNFHAAVDPHYQEQSAKMMVDSFHGRIASEQAVAVFDAVQGDGIAVRDQPLLDADGKQVAPAGLDTSTIDTRLDAMRQSAVEFAAENPDKLSGLTPEQFVKVTDESNRERVYTGVLNQFVSSGNDVMARLLFAKVGNQLPDAAKLSKDIDEIALEGDSQRAMDGIMNQIASDVQLVGAVRQKVGNGPLQETPRPTLEELHRRALSMTDQVPEHLRATVRKKIDEAVKLEKQKQTLRHDATFNDLYSGIESNDLDSAALERNTRFKDLPGPRKDSLRTYLKSHRDGTYASTDPALYDKLSTMAAEDPEAFLRESLIDYSAQQKLSASDRTFFEGRQQKIKAGLTGKGVEDGFISAEERTNQAAAELFPKAHQATERGTFKRAVNALLVGEHPGEKNFSMDDTEKAIKIVLKQEVWSDRSLLGRWFPEDARDVPFALRGISDYLTRSGQPVNDATIRQVWEESNEIPRDEQHRIAEALRANGKPVDGANIYVMWKAKQAAGKRP